MLWLLSWNTVACIVCLPRHVGACLSQTPASLALCIRHTLNLSPSPRVKSELQLNVASELIFLPSVNITDPSAGASKGWQFIAVNWQHTRSYNLASKSKWTQRKFVKIFISVLRDHDLTKIKSLVKGFYMKNPLSYIKSPHIFSRKYWIIIFIQ